MSEGCIKQSFLMSRGRHRKSVHRLGTAAKQVLFAIGSFNGPVTKRQILNLVPHPSETGVPQTINRLRQRGLVVRTNGSGPGTIGTYRLTDLGTKKLSELKKGAS